VRAPATDDRTANDQSGRRNLDLLIQLRWLAAAGQLGTVLAVHMLGVPLPLVPMTGALLLLVAVNAATMRLRDRGRATERALLGTLLADAGCLTVQLALSGGAENPFVSLFLLQVVLGAVLLGTGAAWALVAVTVAAYAGLALAAPPLALPAGLASHLSAPYLAASWFNYAMTAVLLVAFVTRIARNLRDRDRHLAELAARADEEEQIVRMGLLASGAAHELGTPLASLSVALGDWRADPRVAADAGLSQDVADMQAEVARCKDILAGILFAAGEVTGQAPRRTTLARFVDEALAEPLARGLATVRDRTGAPVPIVADRALAQTLAALVENAAEAGASTVAVTLSRDGADLVIAVTDDGSGFAPHMLAGIGKPYRSTKDRRGAGLGLFLAGNVLRTLGGTMTAANRGAGASGGGARVTLRFPAETLAYDAGGAQEPAA